MKFGRCLVIAGGIILLVGGLMHGYGYKLIEPKFAAALSSTPQLLGVFQALWLAFAVEFILVGLIVLGVERLPVGRIPLLLCALIPGLTSILMFHYIGVFIGAEMNALASFCILVGSLLRPRARESHPASRMW